MIKLTNLLKESAELDKAKNVYNKAVDIQKEIDSLEKQKISLVNQYADLRKGLLNAEYDRLIASAKKLYPKAKGVKKVGDGVLVQLPKGEFIEKPFDVATKLSSEIGTPSSVKVGGRYEMDKPGSYSAIVFQGFYIEFSIPYIKSVTNLPVFDARFPKNIS